MATKHFILSVIIFSMSSSGFAQSPRPYLGGGFLFGCGEYEYRRHGDVMQTSKIYNGFGAEAEAGIAGQWWDIFISGERSQLAYEKVRDAGYPEYSYWVHDSQWDIDQLNFGARIHAPFGHTAFARPLLGGGFTFGNVRLTERDRYNVSGPYGYYHEAVNTHMWRECSGVFGEVGMIAPLTDTVRLMVVAKYQRRSLDSVFPVEDRTGIRDASIRISMTQLL